jgi:CRP-like cAMP-binding protein
MNQRSLSLWECPLFSDLSEGDIIAIAQNSESRKFEADDELFKEGDEADGIYVVLSGQLKFSVISDNGHTRRTIGDAGPGEYVGEFSLLDGQPRSASVNATRPTETIFISAKAFAVLLNLRPSVAVGMHGKLASIVRKRTGRVITTPKNVPTRQELGELTLILREYNNRIAAKTPPPRF